MVVKSFVGIQEIFLTGTRGGKKNNKIKIVKNN